MISGVLVITSSHRTNDHGAADPNISLSRSHLSLPEHQQEFFRVLPLPSFDAPAAIDAIRVKLAHTSQKIVSKVQNASTSKGTYGSLAKTESLPKIQKFLPILAHETDRSYAVTK